MALLNCSKTGRTVKPQEFKYVREVNIRMPECPATNRSTLDLRLCHPKYVW